mgnify:CR=1 FL=1
MSLQILVIDDERPALDELAFLLGRDPRVTAVLTAGSAAEAFGLLQEQQVDAVFTDIAMPGEDGYALIRRVRALPSTIGEIPAVALTAYTDPQSVQEAFAAGFDAHLGKPLEPHVLADALTKVLRVRRSA